MKRIKYNLDKLIFQSRTFIYVTLLLMLLTLSGCVSIQLRMGTETQPQNIETVLQLKQSTQEDVKKVFGPPDGLGAYVSPVTGKYSTVWSYYFAQGTLETMDDTFLYIYFDDDIYEGYLWFENTL